MVVALTAISAAVAHGQNDAAIWAEVARNIYLRKKLVDSESKRRKDAHEMMTKDQVLATVGSIVQAVVDYVPDVQQRQKLVDRLRLLTAGPARTRLGSTVWLSTCGHPSTCAAPEKGADSVALQAVRDTTYLKGVAVRCRSLKGSMQRSGKIRASAAQKRTNN
jgi:hypothetical protein